LSTPFRYAAKRGIDTICYTLAMNDITVKPSITEITIHKTKSGFIVTERANEGYIGEQHACTDDVQVNVIISAWTNQKQYS
jgi:hypothetical protein